MPAPTIGIDVGGTKISGGVLTPEGTLIARRELPTESDQPNAIVTAVIKVANELRATAPAAAAIGCGAAGLVDSDAGVILGAPNLSYRNLPLRALVHDRCGLPVIIDNDANVAALGEALYGAGTRGGDQIMVTVGTGIGGGIVIDGGIYRGFHGVGAELGHIVIDPHGPVCGCGNTGCLEALASGTALGRVAREGLPDRTDSSISKLAPSIDDVTGAIVGKAAVEGDPFAIECVQQIAWWLGVGLASFVNIFDPAIVVVGGGVTEGVGEILLEPARASMREHIVGLTWRTEPPVVAATLGNDAGIVGAGILARTLV